MPMGNWTRTQRSPSSSSGRNSLPSWVKRNNESATPAVAPSTGIPGRRRHQRRAGMYGRRSPRSSGLSRSDGGRLKRRLVSTGITVSVNTSAPITASEIVTAMGRKRSEEHTSELQSLAYLVCRLLLEKKKKKKKSKRSSRKYKNKREAL